MRWRASSGPIANVYGLDAFKDGSNHIAEHLREKSKIEPLTVEVSQPEIALFEREFQQIER